MRFPCFFLLVIFLVAAALSTPCSGASAPSELNSTQVKDLFIQGELAIYSGQYPVALADFDQLIAILPSDARYRDFTIIDVWVYKGEAHAGLKQYDEALAAYNKALTLNPNDSDAWKQKSILLRIMNRTSEADQAEDNMRQAAQKELDDFDKTAFANPTPTKSPLSPLTLAGGLGIAGCLALYAQRKI